MINVDVRVALTIKLFRRSIINYSAFRAFFQNANCEKSAKDIVNCLSAADWSLVIEMEAILQRVAQLSLIESQSANILSSTMYVLLRVAHARMNSFKFSAYQLDGPRDEVINEHNFPRVELRFDQLSDLGHRCIQRTLHQIAFRLPKPSVQMGMALMLDPRTKRAAKTYLRSPDSAEAVTKGIMDWAEIAKLQYPDMKEHDSVLAKLSIRNKHHSPVWNVEQLCQNIDVCQWFREVGEQEFPSVAKLARVWLGRGSSTAFQELVFST